MTRPRSRNRAPSSSSSWVPGRGQRYPSIVWGLDVWMQLNRSIPGFGRRVVIRQRGSCRRGGAQRCMGAALQGRARRQPPFAADRLTRTGDLIRPRGVEPIAPRLTWCGRYQSRRAAGAPGVLMSSRPSWTPWHAARHGRAALCMHRWPGCNTQIAAWCHTVCGCGSTDRSCVGQRRAAGPALPTCHKTPTRRFRISKIPIQLNNCLGIGRNEGLRGPQIAAQTPARSALTCWARAQSQTIQWH